MNILNRLCFWVGCYKRGLTSGVNEDKIDALKDLDKFLLEDSDEDDELEEGEFLPPEISDWKSDEDINQEDDEFIKHVVPKQRLTEAVLEGSDGEKLIDQGEILVNDEVSTDDKLLESEEKKKRIEELKREWFRSLPESTEHPVFREEIDISHTAEPKRGIICWLFDSELKYFVIKRYDGIQYLKNNRKTFNSIPKCEIRDLAKMELINRGRDPYANTMARIIRKEVRANEFKWLKPRESKWMSDKSRIDPRTNRPWKTVYYKSVKCLKKIPLKPMPQDILKNLKWWSVDCSTGEAVMEDEDNQELLRVYDSLHLVNLSKDDLLKLNGQKIFATEAWEDEARKYAKVVQVCVEKGIFAGSKQS